MSEIGIEAPPTSRVKLRAAAESIRELLQYQEPHLPVLEILELSLGAIAPGFTYDYVPETIMADHGVEALTCLGSKVIFIPEETMDLASMGDGRARFTVSHELAHAVLHGDVAIQLPRSSGPVPAYKNPEWQANYFSSEILAPVHIVNRCRSLGELMSECGISRVCAEVRIQQLVDQGLLDEESPLWDWLP